MKAVLFDRYGAPDVLEYRDRATPEPGPGEVRVRVAASAFNALDAGIRGGYVRDAFPVVLPHIPGYDVSGIVDAVGEGVASPVLGDPVVGFLSMTADGGAAQFVIAPFGDLVSAPTTVPLVDAAALPSVATTAWQALFDAAGLEAGQRLLVSGAGGAVGGYAVELAKHVGAYVIATTDTAGVDTVRGLGADEVIDHSRGPVELDQPVDAVLNVRTLPLEDLSALVSFVADGGVVVNTVPSVHAAGDNARSVRAVGFFVRPDPADLRRLVALVDDGSLQIRVDERLPLDALPSVNERYERGELRSKVVVLPPPTE